MNNKVLLFDLDGTLTDSGPGITNCVQYALDKMGYGKFPENVLRSFIGPPLVSQFMSVVNMSYEQTAEAVKLFRSRYSTKGVFENSLYPGITKMLELLTDRGFLLGVTSAKPMHFVNKVVEYFDIKKYFSVIKGSLSDGENPNKVDVIGRSLNAFGYADKKELVWLVGDRKYDIIGAKLTGIGFYGAGWGYAEEGELEQEGAVKIASDPLQLAEMITKDLTDR